MFGSLPSAIFLFKSIASVPAGAAVIPVINTNQTVTIAVELENGETIVGQCAISHPTEPPASVVVSAGTIGVAVDGEEVGVTGLGISDSPDPDTGAGKGQRGMGRTNSMRLRTHFRRESRTFDTTPMDSPVVSTRTSLELGGRPKERDLESAWEGRMKTSSPTSELPPRSKRGESRSQGKKEVEEECRGNIGYVKGEEEVPLEARIQRLFYINLYGQVSTPLLQSGDLP